MKLKHLLLLGLLSLLSTSCMSLALKVIGAYDKEAKTSVYTNTGKTVVYIPMKHIGLKEFYANIKHKVDSLQHNGYIVFMESVRVTDSLTPAQKDTLNLKVRKMIGVALDKNGYIDTINGTLMGRKFKNRRGLINQPRYYAMGVDTIKGHIVDVPINKLIAEYERQFGALKLDSCDYTTPLKDKYSCGKANTSHANAIILKYRNENLARAITNEKNSKIAVLYGAKHENGLFAGLKAIDSAWVYKSNIK